MEIRHPAVAIALLVTFGAPVPGKADKIDDRLRSAPLGMTENVMAAALAMSSNVPKLHHALSCRPHGHSDSSVRPSA